MGDTPPLGVMAGMAILHFSGTLPQAVTMSVTCYGPVCLGISPPVIGEGYKLVLIEAKECNQVPFERCGA